MTGLVKRIDKQLEAAAGKTLRAPGVFVLFVQNSNGLDKQLRELAEKEKLKRVCLGIGAPPQGYAVSRGADVTVVIYRLGKRRQEPVTANFALRKGELDEAKADAIVKALAERLPK